MLGHEVPVRDLRCAWPLPVVRSERKVDARLHSMGLVVRGHPPSDLTCDLAWHVELVHQVVEREDVEILVCHPGEDVLDQKRRALALHARKDTTIWGEMSIC